MTRKKLVCPICVRDINDFSTLTGEYICLKCEISFSIWKKGKQVLISIN